MPAKLNIDQAYKGLMACTACMHGLVVDGVPTCDANKKTIEFFSPGFVCPKNKWAAETVFIRGISDAQVHFDEDSKLLWLTKADAEKEAELDAEYERVPGLLRWKLGAKSLPADVLGFVRSLKSGRTASPEVVAVRRASCFGPEGGPPCLALKKTDQGYFCSACRCGESARARLDGDNSKLTFGYLECPMGKPGFSNARQKA